MKISRIIKTVFMADFVAGLLITAEAAIADFPEEEKKDMPPMPDMGGMGGMGGGGMPGMDM